MILKINDRIRNRRVEFFNNFKLDLKYDSVGSSFSFDFYFDPQNKEHKELACIGHYHKCTVEHDGQLMLTGYILSQGFSSSAQKELTELAGYSLPGVLEDCEIPPSIYPLQSDGLCLREIAEKMIVPFGLEMIIDQSVSGAMEEVYDTSKASESQSVKGYLSELAAQKNIVISHDERGRLLFTRAKADAKPIFHFTQGMPGVKFTLPFNGQAMHSDITVMKQADIDGGNAGQVTIKNPYVPYVFRSKTIIQSSGDDIDTEQVAKNALASELKNMPLTITMDRWDIGGKIIKPNTIISVTNPEIYLYNKTNWFVEAVSFEGNSESLTATLTCVLPEVYNGQTPQYLFQGINTH